MELKWVFVIGFRRFEIGTEECFWISEKESQNGDFGAKERDREKQREVIMGEQRKQRRERDGVLLYYILQIKNEIIYFTIICKIVLQTGI